MQGIVFVTHHSSRHIFHHEITLHECLQRIQIQFLKDSRQLDARNLFNYIMWELLTSTETLQKRSKVGFALRKRL